MAFEQSVGSPDMHFQSNDEKQKLNQVSLSEPTTASENLNGCFECNICLDSSHDPVVTFCGHLYCWPCIYKWLQVENNINETDELAKCPVCKAYISASSLIPLYGRGTPSQEPKAKKPQLELVIPQRPSALSLNQQNHSNAFFPHHQELHGEEHFSHPLGNYTSMTERPVFGGTNFNSPTINMVGEMVFSGIFGSSDMSLFAYPYSNSYPFMGNGSRPRLRRQEVQLNKSLNRVTIFLFCCVALCLILF